MSSSRRLPSVEGRIRGNLSSAIESGNIVPRISLGVDRMQRNFEPMHKQVETWQRRELMPFSSTFIALNFSLELQ